MAKPPSSPALHTQAIREWGLHYAEDYAPWDIGQPCPELAAQLSGLALKSGAKAIDLGCGTGSNTIYMAEHGLEATGVDSEPLAIERAQARAESSGVPARFLVDDLLGKTKTLGTGYQFLFDRGCYHYVRLIDAQAYLDTLERLTQPGSLLMVLAGSSEEPFPGGPPVVSEAEIREELGALFELQWIQRIRLATRRPDLSPAGWSCLFRRKA